MRNKTKMMLLTALSLCTLSAGVTAVMASAQTETFDKPLTVEYYGASIRYGMEDERNGIRFAVRMEKDVFEYYQSSIETTYTVISDGVASAEIETTDTWYAADDKGVAIEVNGAGEHAYYQTMVYLWNIPDTAFAKEFSVKGLVKQYGVEEMVESTETKTASMEYVAKAAVDSGAVSADDLADYLPEYTVTYDVDGVQTTETVKYGTVVEAVKMAGYDVAWTKDGEAFDFATPITENTTLVATKTLKAILPSTESYMQGNGAPISAEKSYNVEIQGETAAMYMCSNPQAWVEVYAQWKFDVTAEDIAVWKELGYEKIVFKVYAYSPSGVAQVQAYGMSSAESFTNGSWKEVSVSLDTLANNVNQSFWVYFAATSYDFNAAITQPTLVKKYQPKPITVSTDSYMQANGSPADSSKVTVTYNVLQSEEMAAIKMSYNPGSWVEVYAQWKLDTTVEDINAYKALGYTKITFKVFSYCSLGQAQLILYGTNMGGFSIWKEVSLDLDTLANNVDQYFQVYFGAGNTQFYSAITQPVLS